MYIDFDQMPSDSRVWIYQANRKLTDLEKVFISQRLKTFCEQWSTHGSLMPTSFDIRFDQVLILTVDESRLGASGCSIDSSVKTLREIEQKLEINLLDQGKVSYFSRDNQLEVSPALGIKSKVTSGILTEDAVILNPLVKQKSDLENNWLISAKESWLNKYFAN